MGQIITLGDLQDMRGMVEDTFDDLCVVKRWASEVRDPNTGVVTDTLYTPVYDSVDDPGAGAPCRFRMTTSIGVNPAIDKKFTEQSITITQVLLQVPVSAVGIKVNDLVEPTLSLDPQIPDHVYRIDGPYPGQTHGVCRRFWLEIFS